GYAPILPPIGKQIRIGHLLSRYDLLIFNNQRKIDLLEEIAKNTYEEWFLRRPLREGQIGQSLKNNAATQRISIGDYSSIISRGPSVNYELGDDNDGCPVLNQSCIRDGEIRLEKILFAAALPENKSHLYLKLNDILINSMGDGTLGRVARNLTIKNKMIIHNCITVVRAKLGCSQFLLYYFLSSHKGYFESVASGSTGQSSLNKSVIENLEIDIPSFRIVEKFDQYVGKIWENIAALSESSRLLSEARDILADRLMSGSLDIDDYLAGQAPLAGVA
ncbi:restriction endonuclease subunit S, partial [Asticcacaulis sp. AC402]|uniref:restriction endonuclease subunit S n=1 Tax=Asticcacaulis sp. AC402 TaxID=1282361 RepID=UPI0003C3C828